MTLVIIQRKKDVVTFNSDSRISFGNEGCFDQGAKLFEVPVRLKAPAKSVEDLEKWDYELTYGMAVTGSSLNAYALKESISQILSHIVYYSNFSDISIIGLGHFVLGRFKDITKKLAAVLGPGALSEIILGGYCIVENKIRILRFFADVSHEIEFKFEEILTSDGLFCTGNGRPHAEAVLSEHGDLTPLQTIKTVIDNKMEKSVGGVLQHGIFRDRHFCLSGVSEEIISEETGETKKTSHFLGFELSTQKITNDYPMLFISYSTTPVDWKHPKWQS